MKSVDFYLMCYDERWAKFRLSVQGTYTEAVVLYNYKGLIPWGMRDLLSWLKGRYAISYHSDVTKLFNSLGLKDDIDFCMVSNCSSLLDAFWVKPISSRKSFSSVSPWLNSFNQDIARYSFDGKLNGKCVSSGSPDFATGGQFPKCWRRENGMAYMYKAGSSGYMNAGLEPYSEVFCSQLAQYMGVSEVGYTLTKYRDKISSKCRCLADINTGLISAKDTFGESTDYKLLIAESKKAENWQYRAVQDMILLMFLTCDVDRHFGNIGIFVDNRTQSLKGISPLYDHNLSCVPYYIESENLYKYIDSLVYKDGVPIMETLGLVWDRRLKELAFKVRNFKFNSHGMDSVGAKRCDVVNKMLQYQLSKLLG